MNKIKYEIAYITKYYDDKAGTELDPKLVIEARNKELEHVHKQTVYVKVPIQECYDKTRKKPIGTRWVDINKGDANNLEYRSRIVGGEKINTYKIACGGGRTVHLPGHRCPYKFRRGYMWNPQRHYYVANAHLRVC